MSAFVASLTLRVNLMQPFPRPCLLLSSSCSCHCHLCCCCCHCHCCCRGCCCHCRPVVVRRIHCCYCHPLRLPLNHRSLLLPPCHCPLPPPSANCCTAIFLSLDPDNVVQGQHVACAIVIGRDGPPSTPPNNCLPLLPPALVDC